jgi:hypothetical protein
MIDNFKQIKELLEFDSEDDFYHCQIIKRKKEHPELGSNSYVVKTYYIKKIEELDYYRDEMILLATHHNARVQINLNRRSFEKMAFHTQKKIADQLMNRDYRSVRKAYNSCCGKYSNETNKKWIIDVDEKLDLSSLNKISKYINDQQPIGLKVEDYIPTKNGWHIITEPFNLQDFKKDYPDLDIHKNNPTILYIS